MRQLGHTFLSKWQPGAGFVLTGLVIGFSLNIGKEDETIISLIKSEPATGIKATSQTTQLMHIRVLP
jgi:hypothetical protein